MHQTAISQTSKATRFRELHTRNGIFVMPNPWDAGSAKILAQLGFEAIATTSAGLAFSLGKPDGEGALEKDETLANIRAISNATSLPVSADFENGYSHEPEGCAANLLLAAAAGAIGCSIEDATGNHKDPIYSFDLSVARIKASVAAAKSLPFPFTVTARAENLIYGVHDLKDTIRRLEAYAAAGADVLFAPGLASGAAIINVVKAVSPLPVNIVVGIGSAHFSLSELEEFGVKRVSLGSSLARAAYDAVMKASKEILGQQSFGFTNGIATYAEINALLRTSDILKK